MRTVWTSGGAAQWHSKIERSEVRSSADLSRGCMPRVPRSVKMHQDLSEGTSRLLPKLNLLVDAKRVVLADQ